MMTEKRGFGHDFVHSHDRDKEQKPDQGIIQTEAHSQITITVYFWFILFSCINVYSKVTRSAANVYWKIVETISVVEWKKVKPRSTRYYYTCIFMAHHFIYFNTHRISNAFLIHRESLIIHSCTSARHEANRTRMRTRIEMPHANRYMWFYDTYTTCHGSLFMCLLFNARHFPTFSIFDFQSRIQLRDVDLNTIPEPEHSIPNNISFEIFSHRAIIYYLLAHEHHKPSEARDVFRRIPFSI